MAGQHAISRGNRAIAPERALHDVGAVKSGYLCVTGVLLLSACVLASAAAGDSGGGDGSPSRPQTRVSASLGKTKQPSRRPRFNDYQLPAGTTVSIELRSRLSSSGSRSADAIEGRVLRALTTSGGIELVPAGAIVLGTVSEAKPAGIRRPGRLAFTFQIIEHPETGSRATIRTETLTYESQPPAKGHLFADVRLDKGADASVVLLAPLLVSIPAGS
jgi:hypothetical protein